MKNRGLRLARSTLRDWVRKYGFRQRYRQVEEDRRWLTDASISLQERVLSGLARHMDRYERHFEQEGSVDNTTAFAYTGIARAMYEISLKVKPKREKSPEEIKRIADDILEREYGIKRRYDDEGAAG